MATTTDQILTRAEVTSEAAALSFTEIETMAGWTPFADWRPYGQLEPKVIRFYLQTINDQPYICERPFGDTIGGVMGCWPIR